MVKIQQCRNGCGQLITVQEDNGKWKPFNVSEAGIVSGLHDCPNSTYNKGQQQQRPTQWSGTTKSGQPFRATESTITNTQEANIAMALKILIDVNRNVLEILGILNQQITKTPEAEEPKSAADIAYKEIKEPEFNVKTSEDDILPEDDDELSQDDASKKERESGDYGF